MDPAEARARPLNVENLPAPPVGRTGWPWDKGVPTGDIPTKSSGLPVISIVTPSFNQAPYIEETIRSVLLQGYPNLKYIVIDGGSTDGTVEILRKYSPFISHWRSEPDHGQSHAINKGLSECEGEWFNWLNSDDYLLPGALWAMARAAKGCPECHIVSGVTRNLRMGRITESYRSTWRGEFPASLFTLGVNQPGSLLRRDAVVQAGGVREDLNYVMDLDIWIRLALKGTSIGPLRIPDAVAVYRYHEASKTCAGEDVFALEEFAVLHDLFRSASDRAFFPQLDDLRRSCSAHPSRFEAGVFAKASAWMPERAYADRLLVSDNLLFRALRRRSPEGDVAIRGFAEILETIHPQLETLYPGKSRELESLSLIHAMQTDGWSPRTARRAFKLHPSVATVIEIARLFVRRPTR